MSFKIKNEDTKVDLNSKIDEIKVLVDQVHKCISEAPEDVKQVLTDKILLDKSNSEEMIEPELPMTEKLFAKIQEVQNQQNILMEKFIKMQEDKNQQSVLMQDDKNQSTHLENSAIVFKNIENHLTEIKNSLNELPAAISVAIKTKSMEVVDKAYQKVIDKLNKAITYLDSQRQNFVVENNTVAKTADAAQNKTTPMQENLAYDSRLKEMMSADPANKIKKATSPKNAYFAYAKELIKNGKLPENHDELVIKEMVKNARSKGFIQKALKNSPSFLSMNSSEVAIQSRRIVEAVTKQPEVKKMLSKSR